MSGHVAGDTSIRAGVCNLTRYPIACAGALMLTGCAPLLPVAAATSYVAGQVASAYAPDSIHNTRTKGSP